MSVSSFSRFFFPAFIVAGLFLHAETAKAQQLSFAVTGYDVNFGTQVEYNGSLILKYSLDSVGVRSGPYQILRKNYYGRDTTLLFKGEFRSGVLVDTAYWYTSGKLVRKAFFSENGNKNELIPFTEYSALRMVGTIEGTCYTYEISSKSNNYLKALDEYHLGKMNGLSEHYYENGQLKEEFHYLDDKKNGEYESWLMDGTIEMSGNYLNNEMQGNWNYYYKTGALSRTSTYLMGRESDTTFTYYPNAVIHTIALMEDGRRVGDYFENDSAGHPMIYSHRSKGGWQDSVEIRYYPSGKQEFLAHYKYGMLNDKYTAWYPNGKIDSTGSFEDGGQVRTWKYYNDQGKLIRTVNKHGKPDMIGDVISSEVDTYVQTDVNWCSQEVPVIDSVKSIDVIHKSDDLAFLKKYKTITADAYVDRIGQVKWKVTSVMKATDKQKVEYYLNKKYPQGKAMQFNGEKYASIIHYRLSVSRK